MSREQIMQELQRRGVQIPTAAPVAPTAIPEEKIAVGESILPQEPIAPTQTPNIEREALIAELSRRGVAIPGQQPIAEEQQDIAIAQEAAPEQKGFFSRTAEQLGERGEQLGEIFEKTKVQQLFGGEELVGDEQSLIEGVFQTLGTGVGAVGDVIGEGLVSAVRALPEEIKEPVAETARQFLSTSVGQAGMAALGKGIEEWEEFKTNNPRAARNIEATFNVGVAFTPIKGKSVAGRLKGGAKETGRGIKKVVTKAPVVTSDDISFLASGAYKRADDLGGTLKPNFTNKFVNEIQTLTPQTEIGKLIGGDSPFTKAVEKISLLKNKPITLQAAQEFDELIGDAIDGFMDAGRLTKDGKKMLEIQSRFRDAIANATPTMITGGRGGFEALKEGRKLWAASRKLADVERIIQRAELIDNPATAIKTGFRTLLSNPKRARGFTTKERALMRKAAKTGVVSDLARVTLGSRLIPIFTAASGGGLGGTAAATAGSIATRGITNRAAAGRAAAVTKEIAQRAVQ